jgi:2-methylcitrate dehydratase PrpD
VAVVTPTQALLAFAAQPPAIPDVVHARARELIVDTLLVGGAGASAPGADGVLAAAARFSNAAEAPVLGRQTMLGAPAAAFANAFQIHCLEWDAVHEGAVVHALSTVVAAVHAVAHRAGQPDPADVREAIIVGVEIACAIGVAATTPLAFFRPATAGLLGASLAAARVAGIAPERLGDVLGLAYSQCAGTMQAHAEGSIALPVQIALAARAAVTAVDLVEAGLTGPRDPLDGPFGYFALFDRGDLGPVAATLGRTWRTLEVSFKPWPSGRASHATLGALAGHSANMLSAVTARVPPLVHRLVGRTWADDMIPAYARLCLPFLSALMLADGRVDPRRFTAQAFADPALRALGARLTIEVDDNPDPNALNPQTFELTLTGGGRETLTVRDTPGSPANPSPALLHAKAQLALDLAPDPAAVAQAIGSFAGPA